MPLPSEQSFGAGVVNVWREWPPRGPRLAPGHPPTRRPTAARTRREGRCSLFSATWAMSPALTIREIGDIGDTVAAVQRSQGMDKTAADAELARLSRAEWAHHRTQDTLRRTITRLREHVDTQTRLAADLDTAIARRRDTRGDAFAITVDGRSYGKRVAAGRHLLARLNDEAASQLGSRERTLPTGELGGFPLTVAVSRALGEVHLRLTSTALRVPISPCGSTADVARIRGSIERRARADDEPTDHAPNCRTPAPAKRPSS
jgi:hypothetical protein